MQTIHAATLLLLLLLSHAHAKCPCPNLDVAHALAASTTLVQARVTSVDPLPPMCHQDPCPIDASTLPCPCTHCPCVMEPCSDRCYTMPCDGMRRVTPEIANIGYTFKLGRVVRDCRPDASATRPQVFYGLTLDRLDSCGVLFSEGEEVILNLPELKCDGPPGMAQFYLLDSCQGHVRVAELGAQMALLISDLDGSVCEDDAVALAGGM